MTEVTDSTPVAIDAKLAAAFVAFQHELTPVPKTADNPFFKSKYADLGAVQRHVAPLLGKHKLAVMQPVRTVEGKTQIVTRLIHESGAYIEEVSEVVMGAKQDAQGKGSAITYERRYAYMAITGASAEDEDDDGNAASGNHTAHRGATKPDIAPAPKPSAQDESKKLGELLAPLMKELSVSDEQDKADFFQDAIGKIKPATVNDLRQAIDFAETALADRKEAA